MRMVCPRLEISNLGERWRRRKDKGGLTVIISEVDKYHCSRRAFWYANAGRVQSTAGLMRGNGGRDWIILVPTETGRQSVYAVVISMLGDASIMTVRREWCRSRSQPHLIQNGI